MDRYVGARRADVEPRWLALLEAALSQPQPSAELRAALEGLRKRRSTPRHDARDPVSGCYTRLGRALVAEPDHQDGHEHDGRQAFRH